MGRRVDGMHILMGYGAITFDNTDEGRKVCRNTPRAGSRLINSWFRAARKSSRPPTVPPRRMDRTVYVGAMWVGRRGGGPGQRPRVGLRLRFVRPDVADIPRRDVDLMLIV